MKQIFARLSDEEGEAFEALAKRNERSVSAEARLALRGHVEKSNGSAAPPLKEKRSRAAQRKEV